MDVKTTNEFGREAYECQGNKGNQRKKYSVSHPSGSTRSNMQSVQRNPTQPSFEALASILPRAPGFRALDSRETQGTGPTFLGTRRLREGNQIGNQSSVFRSAKSEPPLVAQWKLPGRPANLRNPRNRAARNPRFLGRGVANPGWEARRLNDHPERNAERTVPNGTALRAPTHTLTP